MGEPIVGATYRRSGRVKVLDDLGADIVIEDEGGATYYMDRSVFKRHYELEDANDYPVMDEQDGE